MHQINPASSTQATTGDAIFFSFRQAALTEYFDEFARLEGDLDAVALEACQVVAEGMEARFTGMLQYRVDHDVFVLQAGTGWPARMIGCTRVAADVGTTAGLAWLTGQLVQFRQLDAIGCIRVPEAMVGHGIRRMVSVPIRGGGQKAFGVLEVGSTDADEFTRRDLTFLQSIADIVAAVMSLQSARLGWPEQAELLARRQAALPGRLNIAVGHQDPVGIIYQQDARAG